MKRRGREINIFSISMLDVISGALGAFLILVILLLPYYDRDLVERVAELEAQVASLQTELEQERSARAAAEARAEAAEARAAEAEARAAEAERRASETVLLVMIRWDTPGPDVDLHVVDPTGAEFYWEHPEHPGRPGQLSEDDREGPGVEIWELAVAEPGTYRIYYNLYDMHGAARPPVVRGRVVHRDGSTRLPDRTLRQLRRKQLVAEVVVDADGGVVVRTP